jgi:hypothetical protein
MMTRPGQNSNNKDDESFVSILREYYRWHYKLLGKLDWRILLPIGLPVFVYVAYFGPYPSLLGYVGVLLTVVGLANLGMRVLTRNPVPDNPSLSAEGNNRIRTRFYWELFALLLLLVAVVVISLLNSA